MSTTTNHKQLLAVEQANVNRAIDAIDEMSRRRGFVFVRGLQPVIPAFPSKAAKKKFQKRMNRAIARCSMPTANVFLRSLGHAPVEYSEKEKAIRAARKKYRELRDQTKEAYTAYLKEKGAFYGGRVRVAPDEVKKAA